MRNEVAVRLIMCTRRNCRVIQARSGSPRGAVGALAGLHSYPPAEYAGRNIERYCTLLATELTGLPAVPAQTHCGGVLSIKAIGKGPGRSRRSHDPRRM